MDKFTDICDNLTTECDRAITKASLAILAALTKQDNTKTHLIAATMIEEIKVAVTKAEQELREYEDNRP